MFYGYTRVSTRTQEERGYGLAAQQAEIEKYASANGITIEQIFTDAGISGAVADDEGEESLSKRPALIELLAAVKEGDTVIVLNTSRLWRSDNAKVLIRRELMHRGANIRSIEQPRFDLYAKDPNDRLIDGIMALLDEWERLSIALKLARGRATKARGGDKPAGVTPYGYRYSADKKSVEIDEAEGVIVKRIFSLTQTGHTLQQIADILTAQGITTRQGKNFSKGSLSVILKNTFYTGILTHAGKPIAGNHPALISKVQFGKCQKQLARRHK